MENGAIIEKFIDYLQAERRYSPLTVRNYSRDIADFIAWGSAASEVEFSLEMARSEDVRNWELYLADVRGLKPQTINRMVASLRSLYHFLCNAKSSPKTSSSRCIRCALRNAFRSLSSRAK